MMRCTNNLHIYRVRNIAKVFRNGSSIRYVGDLDVRRRCFTFITGENGTGKTTLMNILSLLDRSEPIGPDSILQFKPDDNGQIDFLSFSKGPIRTIRSSSKMAMIRRSYFRFLPQGGLLLDSFSIQENLELALRSQSITSRRSAGFRSVVDTAIRQLGFENKRCDSPLTLSGGQRQNLALRRAIVGEPTHKVIFIDEPTTYLSSSLVETCLVTLSEFLINYNCSIIAITHDYEELRRKLLEILKVQYHMDGLDVIDHLCLTESNENGKQKTVQITKCDD